MNVEAAMQQVTAAMQQVTAAMLSLQSLLQTLAALAPPAAAKKPAGRPKRAIVSLPEPSEDGAPTAGDYRLTVEEIKMDSCLGRRMKGGEDKRWKPAVYREFQCGGKNVEGSNLCETCTSRLAKYVEAPKAGDWTGIVTEEPLDWVHMLGTAWAADKQPKWVGVSMSSSGSEAGSAAGEVVAAAPKVSRAEAAAAKAQEEALTIAKETFAKTLAKAAAIAEAAKAEKAEKAAAAAKAKAAAAKARAEKAAAVAKARAEKAAAAAADAQNKADQAARAVLFLALIAPDDVDAHAE
jgi:hypothetical protein